MKETERLSDELRRARSGDAWHGPSLSEVLTDVSGEQALARPIATAHNIWELVLHLTAWAGEVRRRLEGAPAGSPPEGDWPPVPTSDEAGWREAVERLERTHEELCRAIAEFPEERLNDPVLTATDRPAVGSHYVLLHGVTQHMAYHAGQITLLKKAASRGS